MFASKLLLQTQSKTLSSVRATNEKILVVRTTAKKQLMLNTMRVHLRKRRSFASCFASKVLVKVLWSTMLAERTHVNWKMKRTLMPSIMYSQYENTKKKIPAVTSKVIHPSSKKLKMNLSFSVSFCCSLVLLVSVLRFTINLIRICVYEVPLSRLSISAATLMQRVVYEKNVAKLRVIRIARRTIRHKIVTM